MKYVHVTEYTFWILSGQYSLIQPLWLLKHRPTLQTGFYTAMLYIMFSSLESTLLYITLSHHLTEYVQFLSSLNRPGQCQTHFVFCTLSGSRMVQVAATEHWQLHGKDNANIK